MTETQSPPLRTLKEIIDQFPPQPETFIWEGKIINEEGGRPREVRMKIASLISRDPNIPAPDGNPKGAIIYVSPRNTRSTELPNSPQDGQGL